MKLFILCDGIIVIILCLMATTCTGGSGTDSEQHHRNSNQELPEVHGHKFYYFAFGSNMLAQRIHIQNPTAEKIGAALLNGYRLDFANVGQRWRGAVATIVQTENDHVWGTLWNIDLSNLPDIDNQEGVHLGTYVPITIHVHLKDQNVTDLTAARAYMLTHQPETNLYEISPGQVPESRQPSKTYLQCLIKGAIESSLPEAYIERLRSIKHNGAVVSGLEKLLQLHDVQL